MIVPIGCRGRNNGGITFPFALPYIQFDIVSAHFVRAGLQVVWTEPTLALAAPTPAEESNKAQASLPR